jgi:hypothetical protein
LTTPLYNRKLGVRSHRLLWWLLVHQGVNEGVATGVVPAGWRIKAARELNLAPAAMWKATTALKDAKVIAFAPYQKTVQINGDAFKT